MSVERFSTLTKAMEILDQSRHEFNFPYSSSPALIFDTETTGIKDARLIEAAWIETDFANDGALIFGTPFNKRYNPGKPSDLGALKTHHILDSELQDKPDYLSFSIPEGVVYLIGQNIGFDVGIISGIMDTKRFKLIDTLGMSRKLWPECDSHSLTAVIYRVFGRTPEVREIIKNAHSALIDCSMTWHLLEVIIQKANIGSLEQLYQYSEMCTITTERMRFGKYKDHYLMDIAQNDPGYLKWIIEQSEMDEGLKKICRKILDHKKAKS